jgi:phage terminase small subunit
MTAVDDWEVDLTQKQRAFVREYLVDLNATQAAIRAGYSEDTARAIGCENLTKPNIQDAIATAMRERAERTNIRADMVLKELAKIGFSDIRKAAKWTSSLIREEDNPDGGEVTVIKHIVTNTVQVTASDEIDDDTAAAISEISQDARGGVKIKFHDKRAALVDMGKHLGLFKDKVEVTGKDGAPIAVSTPTRDIAKAVALILARGMNGSN